MEQRRAAIKMEEHLDNAGLLGRISLNESCTNSHPQPADVKSVQASATVLVEKIPDELEPGMILSSEPRVFEGLDSMNLHRGPPRTATLVYSATAYAEAMLYRSASSLNKEYGMKLSLAPCHLEGNPSRLTAATERSGLVAQTPMPHSDTSQPRSTIPSSSQFQPPGVGSSVGASSAVDTRSNRPGDFASPSASSPSLARLYQPCRPRSQAARNSILAASRLGHLKHGNASHMAENAIPPGTATSSSTATKITQPPTPTNLTSPGTIVVATSSLTPSHTHSASTPSNAPSCGDTPASNTAFTSTHHSTPLGDASSTFRDTRSSLPMTRPQQKFLLTGIQRMSKRKVALFFAEPVEDSQMSIMGIGNYFDVITKPMDLRTMEEKLKNAQYSNIDEYVADFAQILENTVRFNGRDHPVTLDAYELRKTFEKQVRDACQTFSPDAEQASPLPKNGRPRKHRKVGEEVMGLIKVKRSSSESDSDEEAYNPRAHRRRSTGRSSGRYVRRA